MELKSLEIIDWYDDVIVGIGFLDDEYYSFALLAKDFKSDGKVYFVYKIKDSSSYKKLIELNKIKGNWKEINEVLTKVHSENEEGYVLEAKNLKVGSTFDLSNKQIKEITFPLDVESFYNMPEEERKSWFSNDNSY